VYALLLGSRHPLLLLLLLLLLALLLLLHVLALHALLALVAWHEHAEHPMPQRGAWVPATMLGQRPCSALLPPSLPLLLLLGLCA
jgi:hypothetical protein